GRTPCPGCARRRPRTPAPPAPRSPAGPDTRTKAAPPGPAKAARTSTVAPWGPTLRRRGLLLPPGHLALLVQQPELVVAELEPAPGEVLLQVLDLAGAGDGQHHRAPLQQPRQGHRRGGDALDPGHLVQRPALLRQRPRRQREPGDEAD